MPTPHQNTAWQTRIKELLRQGYGVEDIAIKTKVKTDAVRREVQIMREEGTLCEVLGVAE